jgi:ABC-type polysaccharide/polyol phosphate transport system ATPase subunit
MIPFHHAERDDYSEIRMAKIELTDVSVTFNVHQQKRVSLKEYLVRGLFRRSVNPALRVRALEGVNLTARDGERVGVIGHNGAGKSTLLKTLAGIYPPTTGTRVVEGKICSLFDITLGFETEATGWENILYRSYLQGETPASIRGKLDEIAAFSELGNFLNIAVRNYSAGMLMRLAFSIATAIDPEVLLVDEVLAVGDLAFLHKAKARMRELMNTARVMVMVAHDLDALREMCTRVVWMTHGRVVMDGETDEVIDAYTAAAEVAARKPPAAAA